MAPNTRSPDEFPAPFREAVIRAVKARDATPTGRPDEWRFLCPRHDDTRPSADYDAAKLGWVCRSCGASGGILELSADLGVTVLTEYGIIDPQTHVPVAIHIRYDWPGDGTGKPRKRKWMKWSLPDGRWGLNGLRISTLPLFNAHLLRDWPDKLVLLSEGEKDADNLTALGFPSVGSVTGASSCPSQDVLSVLRGRAITIWPDFDPAGAKHAKAMATVLSQMGVEANVILYGEGPGDGAADFIARAGTKAKAGIRRLMADARPWREVLGEPEALPGRVEFVDVADLLVTELEPVVPLVGSEALGVLFEADCLTLVSGKPRASKTSLVQHVGLCVATGLPAFGRYPVRQARVAMIEEETGLAIHQSRLRRLMRGMDLDAEDLPAGGFLLAARQGFRLNDEKAVSALIEDLLAQGGCDLAVLDPLARFMPGKDENSAQDMGTIIDALARIQRELQCSVIVTHHDRKSGGEVGESSRGSSALWGACSVVGLTRDRAAGTLRIQTDPKNSEPIDETVRIAYSSDAIRCEWLGLHLAFTTPEVRDRREHLLDALKDASEPLTRAELAVAIGLAKPDANPTELRAAKDLVRGALEGGVKAGIVLMGTVFRGAQDVAGYSLPGGVETTFHPKQEFATVEGGGNGNSTPPHPKGHKASRSTASRGGKRSSPPHSTPTPRRTARGGGVEPPPLGVPPPTRAPKKTTRKGGN